MTSPYQATHVVLGLDLIGYSKAELKKQKSAQEQLERILVDSVKRHWSEQGRPPKWIDAGDGGYMLFVGSDEQVLNVAIEISRLLSDANEDRQDASKLHLRYAIHKDDIYSWEGAFGPKYTGAAINNCARLLSGMSKDYVGQAVCSEAFRAAISTFKAAPVVVQRLHDIKDKHGNSHQVFNLRQEPTFGVTPNKTDVHENPVARFES
jgi:hypothetical protein